MGEKTGISWCDHTFNPWWGCQEVSPACDHCYARSDAHRYFPRALLWGPNSERRFFSDEHWRGPIKWASRARAAGVRRKVFCASMADVFDNHGGLDAPRARLFALIEATPELDWLLLTKRVGNAMGMVPEHWLDARWPRNAWLGMTAENQEVIDRDLPKLARTPAPVRFISAEPLIAQMSLAHVETVLGQERCCGRAECLWCGGSGTRNKPVADWVIVGGESGAHARPMHVDWARGLRDECAAVGTAFHFKQWGEWIAEDQIGDIPGADIETTTRISAHWINEAWWIASVPRSETLHIKAGRAVTGNLLDGRLHQQFPGSRT